jgi:pimeloyl-ACP methyl ester carboxylesterase
MLDIYTSALALQNPGQHSQSKLGNLFKTSATSLNMATAQTAVTQYVDASNGVRFAYRRLGPDTGIPLVAHIHYRANMDLWDPLFLNTLSKTRSVIIFDQSGVGRSSGEVRDYYQGWADDLISFVDALGIKQIDLLGFSMGGIAVQFTAVTAPHLVRKLVCAGTSAPVPMVETVNDVVWPRAQPDRRYLGALASSESAHDDEEALYISFFYETAHGRTAFDAYWKRLSERNAEPLNLRLLDAKVGGQRQLAAAGKEAVNSSESGLFTKLPDLKMPVLIANGDNDVLIPSSRSWELFQQIPHAQLIMYPKAGHGFIWQYAELFGEAVNRFLDGTEYDSLVAKL